MTKKIKFYDTSSLLLKANNLFEDEEKFVISSITLEELENIKTSSNKDPDIKYSARKLTHLLDEHIGEYDVEIYNAELDKPILKAGIFMNNDAKILACAVNYKTKNKTDVEFITNDICLKHLARLFFDIVESVEEDNDDYTGYKDVIMTNEEMAYFYSNQ